ncbi:MAG: thermonuclease family protein [Mesorhizobium sp.]|nr:thermonuclease family protein [bacterium M00.F.Ca.ET.205.01.1.1]TGU50614.1 thermonuclease family protein [bacterium M00.F.Ca.ET.152.01.1.1]TGV34072.1 thermonuclease family protein [Mesorhizobium sp. M00.F.Ca.ET.186.01.1.1]TGZ40978.1 thermonuclease family protein [bacterium M00.F.Ca.ET.162.01.1.1]TJW32012.1 MAG: thermonuclease family protein [Mesorhizobium sp.]
MGKPQHARITIAIGSLELLIGTLLIVQAAAFFPVDRSVVASAPQAGNEEPQRPARFVSNSARKIAQDLIAPPQIETSDIERVEPRSPLGELGLAPPATPMPQDWREILLFNPVVTSSAGFESMGRKVTISEVEGVDIDRTCLSGDISWPCGQRARAAFNRWLRGRALKCFVPPETDRFPIAAPCKLGKQDVGAWLVSNGWALALPNGIYGKAEVVARTAEMGIFGPPK